MASKKCSECYTKKEGWTPSQEQIDATAPGGLDGYFPGRVCVQPVSCKHITDYNDLKNRPQINGTTLEGKMTCRDISIQCHMEPISNSTIESMFIRW